MNFKSEWCAFVILYEISFKEVIMVVDADKPEPKLWKFAGGTHDPGDWSSEHTAYRELEDEVPQIKFESELFLVEKYDLGTHEKYFYFAKVKQTDKLEPISEEIDSIYRFSWKEIEEMIKSGDIVNTHAMAWQSFAEQMKEAVPA